MQHQTPDIPVFELYDVWYKPFWKQTWFAILMLCCAVICVLVIAWCIYYLIKRRLHKKQAYWQKAIQSIEELSPREFLYATRTDLFYVQITHVLKSYLERRYNIPLIDKTDQELIRYISASDFMLQDELADLDTIISGAVCIKFAHQQSALEKMQQDKDMALSFIKKTSSESG